MSHLHPPAEQIYKLLAFVSEHQASDLHLKIGLPPYVRIGGHLHALETPPLPDSEYVEGMMKELMTEELQPGYIKSGGADFAVLASSGDRFRVNVFRSDGEMHAALRRIQHDIPDFERLRLPDVDRPRLA